MSAASTDHNDQMLDQNLRVAIAALHLPPAPTAEQLASWRAAPAREEPAVAGRIGPIHRFASAVRHRWLAIGSAAAALIGVAAIVITAGATSTVKASTIVQSLRQAAVSGLNIHMDGVSAEGVSTSGAIRIRFDAPLNLEQLAADGGDEPQLPHVSAVQIALDLMTDQSVGVGGLGGHLEGAATADSAWVFLRTNDAAIPSGAAGGIPIAAIAMIARNGIMLDLGADGIRMLEGLDVDAGDEPAIEPPADLVDDLGEPISIHIGVGDEADDAQAAADDARAERLFRALASGRAGQAELNEIAGLLRDAEAQAEVQSLGGGRYMLVATCPAGPDTGVGSLKVLYTQDAGVQWAEVTGAAGGPWTGTVRIELVNDPIDPNLLNKDRLIELGRTAVFSLDQLKRLIGE